MAATAGLLRSLCSSTQHAATALEPKRQPQCECRSKGRIVVDEASLSRRTLVTTTIAVAAANLPKPAMAEESGGRDGGGILGALTAMLDPNETTKAGRVLPKGYLRAARDVVKTLRESLEAEAKDGAAFRRGADAAKESIRVYLAEWRGQRAVASEESYAALERALRTLASFYANAGPNAAIPDNVKSSILDELQAAEVYL